VRFPWSRPELDVEERLVKVERTVRDLVLDWDQTYEKFRLLSLRLSKRDKREELRLEAPPADDNGRGWV